MTLNELETYYQMSATSNNLWNNIGHDWMVENINSIANSFREYIQNFYNQTYAAAEAYTTALDFLDPYRAVMYMGLQGSQFYQDEVVSTGKDSQYTTYRGVLNALGCGN